jgi:hypothetical protein
MHPKEHRLADGRELTIREADPDDARAILAYVESVSGESEFLSFGPGEFNLSEADERAFLHKCRESENGIFLIGLIGDTVVSALTFEAGRRSRVRHSGEFGLSVRKACWGLALMRQNLGTTKSAKDAKTATDRMREGPDFSSQAVG